MTRKNVWNIEVKGDVLVVSLNGGIDAVFDMTHANFEANKKEKKEEIERYATFIPTSVYGGELLE